MNSLNRQFFLKQLPRLQEKYFAIGTKHKKVYVFDSNNMNKPTYTVNFDDGIKDIKFWYPATGDLFLVVIVRPFYIKFLNVSTMNEVPSISFKVPEADALSVGTFDKLFGIDNGVVNEYYYTDGVIKQYPITRIPKGFCEKLHIENKKIIYVALFNNYVALENYTISTSGDGYTVMLPKNVTYFDDSSIYECSNPKFVFLTSNVILQKSAKGNSCLIICDHRSKWRIYHPFRKFGTKNLVTSGILHGKILILGFKTGHVRIFTVENLEHLKNSTLDLKSGIEYHVHTKSINWLQVTEIQEKLITIAITDDKIYSINFISKNSIE
ncbi:uncharacterized protein LOC103578373 isoform X2 [Microplitis demolitor]|uniref:uncharacterized protein LOC103578373 isoform X2 n=1 Tax=Microplitis demolitor TaxID=69319 RepID=UPI0004CCC1EE|nr:uncharacterized protein LOC103578373 isoform X2 [Microplitis demolitor]